MLTLDYTFMLADAVAGGVVVDRWAASADAFAAAHAAVDVRRRSGELGFFDLPDDAGLQRQVSDFVARTRGRYRDVVLLGIGGSALGPTALRNALRPPQWNTLDDAARDDWPRLHVLDNVDPVTIDAVLARVTLATTLFVVISKSGGTAETMAQYLVVRDRLVRAALPLEAHLVFVTDPTKGALRPIANAEGIPALDIPGNIGGRFSVLSPVGTLPAALIGIDVAALLAGAGDMVRRTDSSVLTANPAATFGVLQWLADTTAGKPIQVLMPYADPLRDVAAWFVQLWAESLGKQHPDGRHVGPTPVPALGATDQHSQVQLFMEGPRDKTVTFLAVATPSVDVTIPSIHAEVPDLAYLGGHSLWELLNTERRATAGALASRGRPSATIEIDRVDAWHVGAVMMFLEIATAYAGALYGINAFDQPGVELGKQFTYGMMGRPGFDRSRQAFEALPQPSPDRRV
ncbi:MAG: glucose-6-phosphate isomerase [Gemmatimonadaceae bacterium]|nr:glucose-6-phosphate isomerase [Gemmatimonadaceae bacterium]